MAIPGVPTTILVAPDSFKGTFSSPEVAAAIGRGLEAAGHDVDLCPIADGGEGTLLALAPALGLELGTATVTDPLGRPVQAEFAIGGGIGVLEMAAASGLGLVAAEDRDAFAATTFGTGELILAAIDAGAEVVYRRRGRQRHHRRGRRRDSGDRARGRPPGGEVDRALRRADAV